MAPSQDSDVGRGSNPPFWSLQPLDYMLGAVAWFLVGILAVGWSGWPGLGIALLSYVLLSLVFAGTPRSRKSGRWTDLFRLLGYTGRIAHFGP